MVVNTLLAVLPWRKDSYSGAEALKQALQEPQTDVDLNGIFGEPHLDTQGANTAVFTVTVYDGSGREYTTVELEYAIETDDGKERLDGLLAAHGIEARENLDEIEGKTANVARDTYGNISVSY